MEGVASGEAVSISWPNAPRPERAPFDLAIGRLVLGPSVWGVALVVAVLLILGERVPLLFSVQALIVAGGLCAVTTAITGRLIAAWFCDCRIGWVRLTSADLDVEFGGAGGRLPLRTVGLVALGGPLANLQMTAAAALAALSSTGHPRLQLFLLAAGPINLWLGVRTLLPLPSLIRRRPSDGLVALRALRGARSGVVPDLASLGAKG